MSVRSARLTDAESLNTAATSGSSLTRLVPCANRWAYLPRTPFEKSYSARISGCRFLGLAFFIVSSFAWRREPGADQGDSIFLLRVDHNHEPIHVGRADKHVPIVFLGMLGVGDGARKGVAKRRDGFFERHTVLRDVRNRLRLVSFEIQRQIAFRGATLRYSIRSGLTPGR